MRYMCLHHGREPELGANSTVTGRVEQVGGERDTRTCPMRRRQPRDRVRRPIRPLGRSRLVRLQEEHEGGQKRRALKEMRTVRLRGVAEGGQESRFEEVDRREQARDQLGDGGVVTRELGGHTR